MGKIRKNSTNMENSTIMENSPNTTTVIGAIGGETAFSIVIGGKSKFNFNDIKDKWDVYKRIGKRQFLLKTINEIIQLPEYIEDSQLLSQVLEGIWKMPNKKIFNGIVRSLELDGPINIAKKNLFWKWKELIESVVMLHLKNNMDAKDNMNLESLLKEWSAYVDKKKIDTSSIVLWCIFNSESPWYRKLLNGAIDNFKYVGYCPDKPNERIKILMDFPIDKLLVDANVSSFNITENLANINKQLVGHINGESIINTSEKNNKINSIHKDIFNEDKECFMDSWIKFNEELMPYLNEQEKYAVQVAVNIDKVADELNKINQKFANEIGKIEPGY